MKRKINKKWKCWTECFVHKRWKHAKLSKNLKCHRCITTIPCVIHPWPWPLQALLLFCFYCCASVRCTLAKFRRIILVYTVNLTILIKPFICQLFFLLKYNEINNNSCNQYYYFDYSVKYFDAWVSIIYSYILDI